MRPSSFPAYEPQIGTGYPVIQPELSTTILNRGRRYHKALRAERRVKRFLSRYRIGQMSREPRRDRWNAGSLDAKFQRVFRFIAYAGLLMTIAVLVRELTR